MKTIHEVEEATAAAAGVTVTHEAWDEKSREEVHFAIGVFFPQ